MNSSYLEPEPRSRKATEDLPEPPDDQEYTKQNSHRPSSRKPPRRLDADLLTRQDIEALIRSRDGGGKYCTGYALSEDGVWRPHSWVMDATGAVVETRSEERRVGKECRSGWR